MGLGTSFVYKNGIEQQKDENGLCTRKVGHKKHLNIQNLMAYEAPFHVAAGFLCGT